MEHLQFRPQSRQYCPKGVQNGIALGLQPVSLFLQQSTLLMQFRGSLLAGALPFSVLLAEYAKLAF
jgi:hypothetical protein